MSTEYGYGLTPIKQPKVTANKAPKAPVEAAPVGYGVASRTDGSAMTPPQTKKVNKGKPSVPKGAAPKGYSNS